MGLEKLSTLEARVNRLKRLVALDAPTFILAMSYHLVMDAAEKLPHSIEPLVKMGKDLEKQFPGFAEQMRIIQYERNLSVAGFCNNRVSNGAKGSKICKEPTLPKNRLCAACDAEFAKEAAEDDAYDASPEGQREIAEYEASIVDSEDES